MSITFVDIVFGILILVLAFGASFHGLIKELFGKGAFVCGIFSAIFFTARLYPYVERILKNQIGSILISSVILFICAYLAVKILEVIVHSIFSGDVFKSLDKALGFIFGACEGLVIVSLIFILIKGQPWFDLRSVTDKSLLWDFMGPFLEKPIACLRGYLA